MIRALLDFLGFRHQHRWEATQYNRWYIPLEERCECGAVRHILGWEDRGRFGEEPNWRAGPRPPWASYPDPLEVGDE